MAVNQSAYQLLMGGLRNMFQPQQPAANASIYDLARADAQRQSMSALGAGLIGAAVPQTPLMRAQALQQAFGSMGNMGTNVYNAAQVRLLEQRQKMEEAAAARDADLVSRLAGGGSVAAPIAGSVPIPAVEPVGEFRPIPPAAARILQPLPPTAAPDMAATPTSAPIGNMAGRQVDEMGLYPEQREALNLIDAPASEVTKQYNEYLIENAKPQSTTKATSDIGKIQEDMAAGRISTEQGNAAINAVIGMDTFQREFDKKIVPDLVDYATTGRAVVRTQLKNLDDVKKIVENSQAPLSGPSVGIINSINGALSYANPQAEIVKNRVQGIAQTQIRQVAGAQYTEKEGTDYMNRAWNPALPIEENMRRVELMSQQMREASEEKERMLKYAQKNNTLKGYQPQMDISSAGLLADFENRIGTSVQNDPMYVSPDQQGEQQNMAPSQPTFSPNRWGVQPVMGQQNSGFR